VTGGTVTFDGIDLLAMEPEQRAAGRVVPGVPGAGRTAGRGNANFLRTALNAIAARAASRNWMPCSS
jgi:Fe-S cluster assembly ATP-binding protein